MPSSPSSRQHATRSIVLSGSVVNLVLGAWLIVAPFALGYDDSDPAWSDVAFGALIAALGLVRVTRTLRGSWVGYLSALAGGWVFVAAFWLDDSGQAMWNDMIAGAIVAILGLLNAEGVEETTAEPPWHRR